MPVKLTPAQAKALGVDTKQKVRVRKTAKGRYHTVCKGCGEEFHTAASEDRHVAEGHNRFELVLETHAN